MYEVSIFKSVWTPVVPLFNILCCWLVVQLTGFVFRAFYLCTRLQGYLFARDMKKYAQGFVLLSLRLGLMGYLLGIGSKNLECHHWFLHLYRCRCLCFFKVALDGVSFGSSTKDLECDHWFLHLSSCRCVCVFYLCFLFQQH